MHWRKLMIAFLLAGAPILWAQTNSRLPATPIIVVTGNGEIDTQPDQAVVNLGAMAQAKDAGDAQQKVSQVIQKSLEALTALGIKKEKISTQSITLSPVYHQSAPNGLPRRRSIVGYEASNILQITVDNLSQIGPAIDAGVAAGADQIDGVTFQLINDTSATQEALKRAVLQAKAKAQAIAGAMGVTLGPAVEVDEGGVQRVMPMMEMAPMGAMASESTPVQPGQIKITATLTVTYKIK